MIVSRDIGELVPAMREKVARMVADCRAAGIDLLITCTYRDNDAQAALYAQGRITAGKIVTNARAGQSKHNLRRAVDVVPLRNGKCVWGQACSEDAALWQEVGRIGEACGLTWAGRWRGKLREVAHFEI